MLKEIVLNKYYGGFSLSRKAIELGASLSQKPCWQEELAYANSNPDCISFQPGNLSRTDATLIRVVRELGAEANGRTAQLEIEEICCDKYRICDHDGLEWIETPESIIWKTD